MPDVKVDGVWLRSLGHVGDVKWSTVWGAGPCGSGLASCTLAVDPGIDLRMLRMARTFEVFDDSGVKVFSGPISEVGRDFPRTISATGWAQRASSFDAINAAGEPTTNPREAVTQAIADGLEWTNPDAFDNIALSVDLPTNIGRLDSLLETWRTTFAKQWGVDDEQRAFVTSNPTEPTWYLDAADLPIGVANEGLYTAVRARYVNSVDVDDNPDGWDTEEAIDAIAAAEFNQMTWYSMPLEDLGLQTDGGVAVAGYAAAQLALLTVPQWLSRVVTDGGRLLTKGGSPAYLPSVRAGQTVRLFNVPTSLGGLRGELGLDVVLGEVEYDSTNPSQITLAPVGLAVRNLADALTQAKRAADAALAASRRAA